jgi:hypothetical protein
MSDNNLNLKTGNNTENPNNSSSTIKTVIKPNTNLKSNKNGNKLNKLSTKINNITKEPNSLLNNNSKCNETLKINEKPTKTNNNKSNTPDNSEGKMACIIS